MSLGSINFKGSKILSPRVGLCSNGISIERSQIDTTARGCKAEKGLGAGTRKNGCAGSGAAHGGIGGHGGSESDDRNKMNECQANYPSPYYFGDEARYEGSGGGSGDRDRLTGGSGGGIIWLTTPGRTNLEKTKLEADGGFGTIDNHN